MRPVVLRRLARKGLSVAAASRNAGFQPRTEPQAGFFGVQMRGAEVHQGLRKSPARFRRYQRFGARANVGLGRRQLLPRSHRAARSRARHCRRSQPRAGRTRSRRLRLQYRYRCRAARAAHPRGQGTIRRAARPPRSRRRAGCARARVVAEARPGLQHLLDRCQGERLHVRPAREKAQIVRRHSLDRGLLQHDLGEPDLVGIDRLARLRHAMAAAGDAGHTIRAARRFPVPRHPHRGMHCASEERPPLLPSC